MYWDITLRQKIHTKWSSFLNTDVQETEIQLLYCITLLSCHIWISMKLCVKIKKYFYTSQGYIHAWENIFASRSNLPGELWIHSFNSDLTSAMVTAPHRLTGAVSISMDFTLTGSFSSLSIFFSLISGRLASLEAKSLRIVSYKNQN